MRVSADIRLIVHRTDASLLLCYVDHHDKAYDWAERRKLETHPETGAAQLVEIRETVQEIVVPVYVQAEAAARSRQDEAARRDRSDDELLGYGVPAEWLDDVRAGDEDTLLALADHLPAEAAEALAGTGDRRQAASCCQPAPVPDPFEHPDAQRRFRVDDERRGAGARARLPVGEVDGLPASRAAAAGSSATTPGRRASPARPAPARPSSRCIAPSIWRARIRTRACC